MYKIDAFCTGTSLYTRLESNQSPPRSHILDEILLTECHCVLLRELLPLDLTPLNCINIFKKGLCFFKLYGQVKGPCFNSFVY